MPAGQFKDHILRRSFTGHWVLAAPVPAVQSSTSYSVAVIAIDFSSKINRVAIVDCRTVHWLDGPSKSWVEWIGKRPLYAAQQKSQHITVAFSEVAFGLRRRVQLGGINGIAGLLQPIYHGIKGFAKCLCGFLYALAHSVISAPGALHSYLM